MAITLLELRTAIRHRADMTNSQFVSDAELNAYVNSSIAELHDLLLAAYDADYYLSSANIAIGGGVDSYALPADFYKLRGVDIRNGSEWHSLRPFNFNERNVQIEAAVEHFRYRLAGSNIIFSPIPSGTQTVRLWYNPSAVKLSANGDTLNDINQWSEYVIVDAAIKCLNKEESDVSVLMATKADLRKRIENMAQSRDAGQPESISDIYMENADYLYFTE